MNWLLWREYRRNRQLLIAGVVLFLLPYALIIIFMLWTKGDDPDILRDIWRNFAVAAIYSYGLSQLTIAFLGGNVFAGERADRSAEFMAYLPVSRPRRLIGKLILAGIVIALIWGLNILIFRMTMGQSSSEFISNNEFLVAVKYTALTGFVMFGVGWCVSSFQSSPTIAVCAGIATPLLVGPTLSIIAANMETVSREFFLTWYVSISITLGIVGFLIGTWCFLKRIEP